MNRLTRVGFTGISEVDGPKQEPVKNASPGETLSYGVTELPDPSRAQHQELAGGDAVQTIRRGAGCVLRVIGDMPDPHPRPFGSCTHQSPVMVVRMTGFRSSCAPEPLRTVRDHLRISPSSLIAN